MQSYKLEREIPVDREYDLVVAGGGPGGAAAAICAARLGIRVLLLEAMGCLGGMGTSGLVCVFDPIADGVRTLVGGFMLELIGALHDRGFMPESITPDHWLYGYHNWTPFHPEGLKLLLDEYTQAAGVEVRFFTRVIDADADPKTGRVRGVIAHNIEGYRYIPAKTFVDATGDAVLADLCGAQCREAGRDTDKIMPGTLCSIFAGIDWDRVDIVRDDPDAIHYNIGIPGPADKVEEAIREGYFTQPDRQGPYMHIMGGTLGSANAGHIYNLNALNCKSLTDGMMLGRKMAQEYKRFYKDKVPGFEAAEHVCTASLMGVRESRRIVGEYELTIDDYMARRQFPDQIGLFNKFVDIHAYSNSEEEYRAFCERNARLRLGRGECHGIPYGILVPRGWENLWVAGRCNSSDVLVHGSIRVMPAAAMMGQAVGTAAVQSIRTGQPACDLDTAQLVESLRQAGAYLPQNKLSREMTRSK